MLPITGIPALAREVALRYAALPAVESVALGGSRSSGADDANSDIDLYVYVRESLSLEARARVAAPHVRAELGNSFWEPGDEWIDSSTGIHIDVMFRELRWIEDRLAAVLQRHEAAISYSTCFWFNVLHSIMVFDSGGWFARLQESARQPYPLALKKAIVAKNFPILRRNMSSYLHQMKLAVERNDAVSLNHRTTALLASYFDILFAVNEEPHPGEKRILQYALRNCQKVPERFPERIEDLLRSLPEASPKVLENANCAIDDLESLLIRESLLC